MSEIITLLPHQQKFVDGDEPVFYTGRGHGATTALATWLLKVTNVPTYRGVMFGHEYHHVRHLFDVLRHLAGPHATQVSVLQMSITLDNNATINVRQLRSWLDLDRLRGIDVKYAAVDDLYGPSYPHDMSLTRLRNMLTRRGEAPIVRASATT